MTNKQWVSSLFVGALIALLLLARYDYLRLHLDRFIESSGQQSSPTKETMPKMSVIAEGAPRMPPGKRGYLLMLNESSIMDAVQASDYIDVMSYRRESIAKNEPVLKHVLVVAIGRSINQDDLRSYLTLAVDPSEAQILAQVEKQGNIKISKAQ